MPTALLQTHEDRHELCLDQVPCVGRNHWAVIHSRVGKGAAVRGGAYLWKDGGVSGLCAQALHSEYSWAYIITQSTSMLSLIQLCVGAAGF